MKQSTTADSTVSARLSSSLDAPTHYADTSRDTRKGVQSVEHAFSLLQLFAAASKPLQIKELAEASGMPASRVHHYLVSLVRVGAIQQMPNGSYDVGPFALQLGLTALRRLEPVELAVDAARQLRDANGEATFISVWGSFGPTIIRYFEGTRPVTVEVRTGHVLPLAGSATGKVFLAWGSESALAPVLARESIAPSAAQQLQHDTQAAGLGIVDGVLLPRIAAIAAPVFDRDGRLALSITQLGWCNEFDSSADGAIASALGRTASQLSRALGYRA